MTNNSSATISGICIDNGIEVSFRGQSYTIEYPVNIWQSVPTETKEFLKDNLAYASTMHLPMMDKSLEGLEYQTNRPYFEPFFFQNFIRDIPSCCDMDQQNISEEMTRFLKTPYQFSSKSFQLPTSWENEHPSGRAIVPLSFGKDSLLSFALAEELGLDPIPVFVHEPSFSQERMHKEILGAQFESEFGKKLNILEHDIGLLRDASHLGVSQNEYGWGLQSTEYALMMLPYAKYYGASYLFFGNEQSASSSYMNSDGWEVFPCYDQTHLWTVQISAMTQSCTQPNPVQTGSLIEPLMDMMIQRILIRRYPQYAKLQMSCFAEGEAGKEYHWCHKCSICTKMYFLCVGANVSPESIGFKRSMLTMSELQYFPLLGGSSEFPYARTQLARDEQLFALYCADRFGSTEPLVELFAKSELRKEAESRKLELFKRFITIYHPSICVPKELLETLQSIFEEEIQYFIEELGEI